MVDNDRLWQTKLHARLHDPAEKALVLMRDPDGHEGGTCRALHRELIANQDLTSEALKDIDPNNTEVLHPILFRNGVPKDMYLRVKKADWWASGADRPNWPLEEINVSTKNGLRTFKVAHWARVHWQNDPVLIHPLTGKQFNLHSLADTNIDDLKSRSFEHFSSLLKKSQDRNGETDWKKSLLTLWRFGPELSEENNNGALGQLWPLLPADTRVPDHSIWDHLDLTSAFAGAFTADPNGEVSLLSLSIGPVQSFIAAARTTSDLWAGSHLLSRLSWEAMKVICERLGPDSILFPRLRGIPQVDLWLKDEMNLDPDLFKDCTWRKSNTDSNPLFAAALPNRLVAAVPTSEAREIAETVQCRVRQWLLGLGAEVVKQLFVTAGSDDGNGSAHAFEQMREQLNGFPEVHWAAIPFSLIKPQDEERQTNLDVTELSNSMAPFFGAQPGQDCGFLASDAWKVLHKEITQSDKTSFFTPKPGVLYPAIYDLAERVMAAAKSARPFEQNAQQGWRCSLTGETEWLCADRAELTIPPGQRKNTIWTAIAEKKPSWAKQGEHLGALPAIKRLWPGIFAEEVATKAMDQSRGKAKRFVVSTHTMALAHQLDQWLSLGGTLSAELEEELQDMNPNEEVVLPRKLSINHLERDKQAFQQARRIPSLLEYAREHRDERYVARCEQLIKQAFVTTGVGNSPRIETYYSLLMLDGDHMGRILSGDEKHAISYRDSFHPQVQKGFDKQALRNAQIKRYGAQSRAISPNRHIAISSALNDFALHAVPHVVEREYLGRLIYAGGDDVLAMLPAADLLSCMQRLRTVYSGDTDAHVDWQQSRTSNRLISKNGFAMLNGKLMRMMGENATASCGSVIAHNQAPMGAVLRELRAAESRAKTEGGRDAFSITLIKRSGSTEYFTAKWGEPMNLLIDVRDYLAESSVSRGAVFHCLEWLRDLPADAEKEMLEGLLSYQLSRQCSDRSVRNHHDAPRLATRLTQLAIAEKDRNQWLSRFLSVAEFMAREIRSVSSTPRGQQEALA